MTQVLTGFRGWPNIVYMCLEPLLTKKHILLILKIFKSNINKFKVKKKEIIKLKNPTVLIIRKNPTKRNLCKHLAFNVY